MISTIKNQLNNLHPSATCPVGGGSATVTTASKPASGSTMPRLPPRPPLRDMSRRRHPAAATTASNSAARPPVPRLSRGPNF